MSKLIETYNKSIFANIGNKVSAIQNKQIPQDIDINKFKTKSILDIQKDFFEEVVIPYATILEEQSNFGKIIVNPTKSVVDLFSKIAQDVSPIIFISQDSNLLKLNSIYDDIRDPKQTYILDSTIPTLNEISTTSVLSISRKEISLLQNTSVLDSNIPEYKSFDITDVLKFNSKFDDIVDFKTTSVLDFNSIFDDVTELPYSNVLDLNSKFDDLIIKDIGSVLKVYVASNLPKTIPGVVDFFENVYAPGFTPGLQKGQSLYNTDKIPPYVGMPDTPTKTVGTIVEMPSTPDKPIGEIVLLADTPEKNITEPVPMLDPSSKPTSDINPPAVTLEKLPSNIIEMPGTPPKTTQTVIGMLDTPEKFISALNSPPEVPEKIKFIADDADFPNRYFMGDVVGKNPNTGIVNFIPDLYAFGFTRNLQPYITQFKLDYGDISYDDRPKFGKYTIPSNWAQLHEVNFIPDEKAVGFTLGALQWQTKFKLTRTFDALGNETTYVPSQWAQTIDLDEKFSNIQDRFDNKVYPLGGTDDKALYQFNWNIPPGYPGVLNQYAVYFSRYPQLTNVTYKTVIDTIYNNIIRVPQAEALYNEGFHTPMVPIGETSLIIPPYKYANDRLPTWANTYSNTLADIGSTLVAGFLSQRTLELLTTIAGVDVSIYQSSNIRRDTLNKVMPGQTTPSGLTQSPLAFHVLAGEVFWEYRGLGTVIRNAREAVINFTSGLVGYTMANVFIPKIESAIGEGIANLTNTFLNATLLDSDKVLMLYHILMGTKYTKSKAFFDRIADTYNSRYSTIGDNAVNIFNDAYPYSETDRTLNLANRVLYEIPYAENIVNVLSNIPYIATSREELESVPIGQMLSLLQIARKGTDDTLIPIGYNSNSLPNPYLFKKDSKTFGTYKEDKRSYYYSKDIPIYQHPLNDEPVLATSLDENYPTPEQLAKNPSLVAKTDLKALSEDTLEDSLAKLGTTSLAGIAGFSAGKLTQARQVRDNDYVSLLKKRLRDVGKKSLEDRGFPFAENGYSDSKNRLNMIKMPKDEQNDLGVQKYIDDDLIDFYFEDLSSFSDNRESIVIPFRAILTTLSDSTNANWASQDYMGRADKFWIYQGFDRRVAINFEVVINSKDEFISSWNKINYLQGMCYPVAYPAKTSLKAPIMALTVGNLFERMEVIMNSVNYSFDGSTLWEIESGFQLPMHIKIAVDFTVIFADTPKASSRHIGQQQDWMKPKIYSYDGTNAQTSKNAVEITETEAGENIPKKPKKEETADENSAKTEVMRQYNADGNPRFPGGGGGGSTGGGGGGGGGGGF